MADQTPRRDIAIRPAKAADAEALGHIGVATFVESYTFDIEGAAIIAHCTQQHSEAVYADYLAQSSTGCWLAEYAATGAPVGYALCCAPDLPVPTGEGDIELKRIYVLSRFHGLGVAGDLIREAEAWAREQGAKRLLLGTYEANHRAMAFYAKHGFEQIGTRQFNVGGRVYDDIVMGKLL